METIELLIKMMWWYGRGLPPRRLGHVVYEWGGFSAVPPDNLRTLPTSIIKIANDVLAHADGRGNIFAITWLWSKPPLALWRFLPMPIPKRRIIYFADWNKMYVSKDEVFAVKWASTDCCTALLWSYPWTWIYSRKVFHIPVPAKSARAKL